MQNDILSKYTCDDIHKTVKNTSKLLKLKENEVLTELEKTLPGITNLASKCNHPSRNLTILSGVNSIAFFPNVSGKRILLLGETHDFDGICTNKQLKSKSAFSVENWLYQLSQNSPECLDIFIEYPYKSTPGKIPKYDSPIDRISNIFKDCGYSNECPLEKLRLHQVDIRRYDVIRALGLNKILDEDGEVYDGTATEQQKFFNHEKLFFDRKLKIINYALGLDKTAKSKKIYIDYFYGIHDIFYETDNTTRDEIFQAHLTVMKFVNKEMAKLDKSKINRLELLKTLSDVYVNLTNETIYGILAMIPIDLYILSRMFMMFDKTKMSRSVSGCRDYSEIKNVIVCVGKAHTEIYKSFMLKKFNQRPNFTKDNGNDNKCIQVKSIIGHPFDFFETV